MCPADYRRQQTNLDAGGGERGEQSKLYLLYGPPTVIDLPVIAHVNTHHGIDTKRTGSVLSKNYCIQ